jgi:hypothetical protein
MVWPFSNVYCGLGLAMADGLPWQMDRLRRRALGWQAEVLGAACAAAAARTTCGRCAPGTGMSADGIEKLWPSNIIA